MKQLAIGFVVVALAACSSSRLDSEEELDDRPAEVDAGIADDSDAGSSVDAGEMDAGGSGGGGATAKLCVDTINAKRVALGLAALARWTDAETCAAGQAESDAAAGELGSAFGECNELGQSTCYLTDGGATAQEFLSICVDEMLAGGAGGGNPLASTEYTKLACGTFQDGTGTWWMAADLR